ncbi:MAG: MgtC/SapB family protein [Planctomycetes bacterium]|nr:MgtC/SapB family protein [Planctomycetota bacterium]
MLDLIGRLVVACLLGAVIGLEREVRQKAAGLRTNALIAFGAALFTILGLELAAGGGDPSRVASTIVTGIGFLGAGAILRTDKTVHGLTTAATIWVNAAIGMAAGSGAYALAVAATAIALVVLWLVGIFEKRIEDRLAGTPRANT